MKQKLSWFTRLPFFLAVRLLLLFVFRRVLKLEVRFSFSEFSEDLLVKHIPGMQKPGTYVDVGCNEPIKLSNTFDLYLAGWTGINIDANERLIGKTKRIRKKDISIYAAVSDDVREVTFYEAKNSAISTIDSDYYNTDTAWWAANTREERKVTTRTLTSILDEHLKPGASVDLLSVDVEGHDMNVLRGLDFNRYRPRVILVELREFDKFPENETHKFLNEKGYSFFAFSVMTGIYVSK